MDLSLLNTLTNITKIKVLVTSGYSERLNKNDTYSVELWKVLAKPYQRSELATPVQDI